MGGVLQNLSATAGTGTQTLNFVVPINTDPSNKQVGSVIVTGQNFNATFTTTQPPQAITYACAAAPAGLGIVRAEGVTEIVPDILIHCSGSGGTAASSVVGDLTVNLNANVTSRILTPAPDSLYPNAAEALLLINEPATPTIGSNTFYGYITGPNSITFHNVILRNSSASPLTMRITNLRVNASQLGSGGSITALVGTSTSGAVPMTPSQPFTIASAQASTTVQQSSGTLPDGATLAVGVNFTGSLPAAHPIRDRIALGQDGGPLGHAYGTESGYVNTSQFAPVNASIGEADTGTRVRATVSNVPAGVTVFSRVMSSCAAGQMVNADASGASPENSWASVTQTIAGVGLNQLSLTSGTANAAWETQTQDAGQLCFGFAFPNATAAQVGQIQFAASLGPVASVFAADRTSPIPRFLNTGTPQTVTIHTTSSFTVQNSASHALKAAGRYAALGVEGVQQNQPITFTAQAVNSSPTQAGNVTFSNQLPPQLTMTSAPAQCNNPGSVCTSQGFSVSVGSLQQGGAASIQYTAQVNSKANPGDVITNTTAVTSDLPNSDLGGSTTTDTFSIESANCAATVTATPLSVGSAGGTITLSVSFANAGASCPWALYGNQLGLQFPDGEGFSIGRTVHVTIPAYTGTQPRTIVLTAANTQTSITQNGVTASCPSDPTFFVTQLYRDLLNRDPDAAGLAYWVDLLQKRGITTSQLANLFFQSPEFHDNGLAIIKYYIAVLGRDPDYGGWTYWFGKSQGTVPLNTILAAFIASPEFSNTYGNLTNAAFVTLVYRNVLGRAPDTGGYNYWVNQLNTGALDRPGVMALFVNSPEFDTDIKPRAYANLLYMGFLRRTGDAAGLQNWAGTLSDLNKLPDVIGDFINSPEYLNRFPCAGQP